MAKLERELEEAGLLVTSSNPNPRDFTYADIGKLRYLDCVVKVCAPSICHPDHLHRKPFSDFWSYIDACS
jgi:hypothetical protein